MRVQRKPKGGALIALLQEHEMSNEYSESSSFDRSASAAWPASLVLSASTLNGDDVYNAKGEKLGSIKEIMLDVRNGKVCYAVVSFGGFLGMGEKLFAVPWSSMSVDTEAKRFVFDVAPERLQNAPGFDKDHWPNMADPTWAKTIHTYYGV